MEDYQRPKKDLLIERALVAARRLVEAQRPGGRMMDVIDDVFSRMDLEVLPEGTLMATALVVIADALSDGLRGFPMPASMQSVIIGIRPAPQGAADAVPEPVDHSHPEMDDGPIAAVVAHLDAQRAPELKPGDLVTLASGGPRMTITTRDDTSARCLFFTPGGLDQENLPLVCLVRVS